MGGHLIKFGCFVICYVIAGKLFGLTEYTMVISLTGSLGGYTVAVLAR